MPVQNPFTTLLDQRTPRPVALYRGEVVAVNGSALEVDVDLNGAILEDIPYTGAAAPIVGGNAWLLRHGATMLAFSETQQAPGTGEQGPAGPTGPTGPTGPAGPAGTPGEVWYSGSGAPPGATGIVGDWYLNTTTGAVSEKTGTSTGPNGRSSWDRPARKESKATPDRKALWHPRAPGHPGDSGSNRADRRCRFQLVFRHHPPLRRTERSQRWLLVSGHDERGCLRKDG